MRDVCLNDTHTHTYIYILGWPLANGRKMKVTNLTVPPFEVVPIIIKKSVQSILMIALYLGVSHKL